MLIFFRLYNRGYVSKTALGPMAHSFNIYLLGLKVPSYFIALMFLWCQVQIACGQVDAYDNNCPPDSVTKPCRCEGNINAKDGKILTTLYCDDQVDLPKLTYVLRNASCGRRLHEFHLSSSGIGYLPSNLFSKIAVTNIKISFTNISHFTEAGYSAFYGLERHLQMLSMRHCRLVDGLNWEKIGDLDALQTLDLSMNDLTTIPKQWFKHPPRNLLFLHLRGNRISYIQPGALATMSNLLMIDLSENQISSLERSVFSYPGNSIAILSLRYNQLRNLPVDFFDELYGIRKLYLDHNQLETLDAETWLPVWGELYELDVSDNRIMCNCGLKWITLYEETRKLVGRCNQGNPLEGRSIQGLYRWDFDDFNCMENEM